MKRCFFMPLLTAAIMLTGLGISTPATAQSPSEPERINLLDSAFVEFASKNTTDTNGTTGESNASLQRLVEAALERQMFEQWFEGITLTAEQKNFVATETRRYRQEFDRFVNNRRARNESWTEAEAIEFEEQFLNRLNAGLTKNQVLQVQSNLKRIEQENRF